MEKRNRPRYSSNQLGQKFSQARKNNKKNRAENLIKAAQDVTRESYVIWRDMPPPPPRAPRGPRGGAAYTCRQMTQTFNTSTSISSGVIAQTGATEVLGAVAFRLDDLNQVSTFSSLFDQYRIEQIRLKFTSKNPTINLAAIASPNQAAPSLYIVIDRDDATAPASINALREYNTCVEVNTQNSIDIDLTPSLTPALFSAGVFSAYSLRNSDQTWIDIANTSVPAYGVKFGIEPLQASASYNYQWSVEAYYTVSFRTTR